MGNEEQQEEIEVLSSIFGDLFAECAEEDADFPFRLTVKHTKEPDLDFCFKFNFPQDYPSVKAAEFKVYALSSPCSLAFPREQLSEFLLEKANCHIGEPQIYTLVTFAQDWLDDWAKMEIQRLKMQEKLRIQQEAAEEEARIRSGTPVTKETFKEWNKKFLAEFQSPAKEAQGILGRGKTGRELFESDKSLASSDVRALGAEGGEAVIFDFDPSLFQEELHREAEENVI